MKSVIRLLLVFAVVILAVPATQAVLSPSLNGMQIYPKDHVWNVPVDKLPVSRMSSTYIASAGSSAYLYVYPGFSLNIVDKYTPRYTIDFTYPSDPGPYPIPSSPLIETQSADNHMLNVQTDTKTFYHVYNAEKESDGSWSGGSGAVFDLSTYALRPDGMTSDAAGLPILPGLIRYEEVAAGEIDHALRISTWNSQDAHIWPARHHAGISSTSLPPMGQRFRLKASVDISKYTAQQQVVLKAMKKYGMILADNTGNKNIWGLSAVGDSRLTLGSFAGIHGSDFEAVDESSLMINKDSGQARVSTNTIGSTPTPVPTPVPTTTSSSATSITVTSPNGGETWTRGTSKTITWSYTGSPGSTVEIDLLKGGVKVGTIADAVPTGTSGKGSYTWAITSSATATTGSDFKVSVQSTSQSAIKDASNGYFTIIPAGTVSSPVTAPSITVTTPNGGESWKRGTSHTVAWSYTGSPGSFVKIVLLKAGTEVGTIAHSVSTGSSGKGSYTWPITSAPTALTGSDFKVSVQSLSQTSIKDASNNYFTISW
jgi:hypothetical protein